MSCEAKEDTNYPNDVIKTKFSEGRIVFDGTVECSSDNIGNERNEMIQSEYKKNDFMILGVRPSEEGDIQGIIYIKKI